MECVKRIWQFGSNEDRRKERGSGRKRNRTGSSVIRMNNEGKQANQDEVSKRSLCAVVREDRFVNKEGKEGNNKLRLRLQEGYWGKRVVRCREREKYVNKGQQWEDSKLCISQYISRPLTSNKVPRLVEDTTSLPLFLWWSLVHHNINRWFKGR